MSTSNSEMTLRSNGLAYVRNCAGVVSFNLKNPACDCDDSCIFTSMNFIGDDSKEEEELMT